MSAEGTEREFTASEQMRDRIADWLAEEIAAREGGGSSATKVRNALIYVEGRVRSFPGRLAQTETPDLLNERTRRNER